MKRYPGAKGNSGIIQFFINKIPYHTRYFELFAGSAQLFRHKKPAGKNYLNDIDKKTLQKLQDSLKGKGNIIFSQWNVHRFFHIFGHTFTRNDFIYLDPPYPKEDRRSGATHYKFEMLDQETHLKLLERIKTIDANIMISTGLNDLYKDQLKDWQRFEFKTIGHKGRRIEVIYINYQIPEFLHQYDLFGDNFTRRQQIKRISSRFRDRLKRIHPYEAHIIIQDIIRDNPEAIKHFIDKI